MTRSSGQVRVTRLAPNAAQGVTQMGTLKIVHCILPLIANALIALFLPEIIGGATNAEAADAAGGISINCGGPDVGSFVADRYFGSAECCGATGITAVTDALIDTSAVDNPAPMEVYQTDRRGENRTDYFVYNIRDLAAGARYLVRLHFAETDWDSPGQREFNISVFDAQGRQDVIDYDIIAEAGRPNTAVVKEVQVTANPPGFNGQIVLRFDPGSADVPKVNGIEIIAD